MVKAMVPVQETHSHRALAIELMHSLARQHFDEFIAYMQPDTGGYYRVFTMRPDGTERQRLELQTGAHHEGGPYWHPSGEFLLVLVQKSEWHGLRLFGAPDYEALPGFGRHDDLWPRDRAGPSAVGR